MKPGVPAGTGGSNRRLRRVKELGGKRGSSGGKPGLDKETERQGRKEPRDTAPGSDAEQTWVAGQRAPG